MNDRIAFSGRLPEDGDRVLFHLEYTSGGLPCQEKIAGHIQGGKIWIGDEGTGWLPNGHWIAVRAEEFDEMRKIISAARAVLLHKNSKRLNRLMRALMAMDENVRAAALADRGEA